MDNQHILLNTDLTTIFDSLAFSIAYETKDGLLSELCIATIEAVVIFTRKVIENANKTKKLPGVKFLFECGKHVKSGYHLWFLATILYKYNRIRCNSMNDIDQQFLEARENTEQRSLHPRYENLINNTIQA